MTGLCNTMMDKEELRKSWETVFGFRRYIQLMFHGLFTFPIPFQWLRRIKLIFKVFTSELSEVMNCGRHRSIYIFCIASFDFIRMMGIFYRLFFTSELGRCQDGPHFAIFLCSLSNRSNIYQDFGKFKTEFV